MALDREKMKAYNQEPEQCWECFNCVKICPQQAIEVRGYSDFVPLGSSTIPLRGSDSIMWTIKFRNGLTFRIASANLLVSANLTLPLVGFWFLRGRLVLIE